MKRQMTLGDHGFERHYRPTRRERFLDEMDKIVPWGRLCALIESHYPKEPGRCGGRPPFGLERMLRLHCLQQWFNLSDPAMEDALYESAVMRRFVGLDLGAEPAPDETTIMRFRHLLEKHALGRSIFAEINVHLRAKGLLVTNGTIVDATIIQAPSSTKNSTGKRDPEMHQTRKGNQWYFGMKVHVGVDSRNKVVHSLEVTGANEHDGNVLPKLLHGEERKVWGDQAYAGKSAVIRERAPHAQDMTNRRQRRDLDEQERRRKNRTKSQVRARGEHPFWVVKGLFGFTKVRYRGLKKNANRACVVFALANLFAVRGGLLGA